MGLLSSNDSSERFEPLVSDGNRVLGRYNDPDTSGTRLVWVGASAFEQISPDEITDK